MMTHLLIVLGINLFLWWENPPRLSPDGKYYLETPRLYPYVFRYPFVWVASRSRWVIISRLATALTSLLILWFTGLIPAVLWLGLSSTRVNTVFPFLTDQTGILFLTAAYLLPPPFNILFGVLGGLVNEKVPVFASLLLWNPLPLIGLAAPLFCWLKLGTLALDSHPKWLKEPFGEARKIHPSIETLILPWGFAVIGLLTTPISWVILAYSQLLVAQDRARLYQWIGPMVCVHAALLIPDSWALPLCILHLLNPWRKVV